MTVICHLRFLGDRLYNGSPYAIGPLSICPICLSCLSVCDVGVLWPNGWMDQDETWCGGRPRPWPHHFRWGPSFPLLKGYSPTIFGPCLLWPNGWMDKVPLATKGGLGPGHIVLDRKPAPPSKKGHSGPKFSAHVYCGQAIAHLSCC